jgi:hypothetical protein
LEQALIDTDTSAGQAKPHGKQSKTSLISNSLVSFEEMIKANPTFIAKSKSLSNIF